MFYAAQSVQPLNAGTAVVFMMAGGGGLQYDAAGQVGWNSTQQAIIISCPIVSDANLAGSSCRFALAGHLGVQGSGAIYYEWFPQDSVFEPSAVFGVASLSSASSNAFAIIFLARGETIGVTLLVHTTSSGSAATVDAAASYAYVEAQPWWY